MIRVPLRNQITSRERTHFLKMRTGVHLEQHRIFYALLEVTRPNHKAFVFALALHALKFDARKCTRLLGHAGERSQQLAGGIAHLPRNRPIHQVAPMQPPRSGIRQHGRVHATALREWDSLIV